MELAAGASKLRRCTQNLFIFRLVLSLETVNQLPSSGVRKTSSIDAVFGDLRATLQRLISKNTCIFLCTEYPIR